MSAAQKAFALLGVSLVALPAVWLGCGEARSTVLVDVRSDLIAGVETHGVSVEHFRSLRALDAEEPVASFTRTVAETDDLVSGLRAAELMEVPHGDHTLRVRMLDRIGRPVLERIAIISVRDHTVVTIVMTRDCRGVTCPAANPALSACVAGSCVDPRCTPETPDACPAPDCTDASMCDAPAASCASALCLDGVCLAATDHGLCAQEEYCDPDLGCLLRPGVDAGAGNPCDSALLCEGFEGGGFGPGWTDTSCLDATPSYCAQATDVVRAGTAALEVNRSGAGNTFARATFPGISTAQLYVRTYLFAAEGPAATSFVIFYMLGAATGGSEISLDLNIGDEWQLNLRPNGTFETSSVTIPRGQWLCTEMLIDVAADGTGRVQVFVDGAPLFDHMNVITLPAAGAFERIDLDLSTGVDDFLVYYDELLISTLPSGC